MHRIHVTPWNHHFERILFARPQHSKRINASPARAARKWLFAFQDTISYFQPRGLTWAAGGQNLHRHWCTVPPHPNIASFGQAHPQTRLFSPPPHRKHRCGYHRKPQPGCHQGKVGCGLGGCIQNSSVRSQMDRPPRSCSPNTPVQGFHQAVHWPGQFSFYREHA